jgi:hypothetical protein
MNSQLGPIRIQKNSRRIDPKWAFPESGPVGVKGLVNGGQTRFVAQSGACAESTLAKTAAFEYRNVSRSR